jgi:hypothetical protein
MIKVEIKVALKYEKASAERFNGASKRSFLAPLTLSCTSSILEQNETVMQLTDNNEEVN